MAAAAAAAAAVAPPAPLTLCAAARGLPGPPACDNPCPEIFEVSNILLREGFGAAGA